MNAVTPKTSQQSKMEQDISLDESDIIQTVLASEIAC